MTQKTEETKEQIEKALNVIDGSEVEQMIFRIDSDTFRFKDVEYKIIENHREAFDMELMEHRFTDYLLKYDYIVGDIAYEKLRLRGFYDDHRKGVPVDMKISNLEDYLIEYCNFGCQYFVFERVEKKKGDPESYFKRSTKPNPRRKSNPRNKTNNQRTGNKSNAQRKEQPTAAKKAQSKTKPKSNARPNNKNAQKEFQVVKKQEVKTETKPTKPRKTDTAKKKAPKKQFEIRKKTDND